MFRLASVLLLLLALFSLSHASTNDICSYTLTGTDYVVTIFEDEGILKFLYFERQNASAVYTVGLKQIWEADNSDLGSVVAGSNSTLTGWNCDVGPMVNTTQFYYIYADENPRFDSLFLNTSFNTGPADFNNSVAAGMIDVSITGYKWVNGNESTQLVLTWFVNYEYANQPEANLALKTKAGKTVDFAGAYFAVNTTAKNGNMSVDVSLSLASKYTDLSSAQQDVYVVYDHFNGDLNHDPEFGFGSGPGSNLLWIIIIVVVIIAILVIILIAVIGFVLVRRRRRSYDSF